jgi:hypothetical protein
MLRNVAIKGFYGFVYFYKMVNMGVRFFVVASVWRLVASDCRQDLRLKRTVCKVLKLHFTGPSIYHVCLS